MRACKFSPICKVLGIVGGLCLLGAATVLLVAGLIARGLDKTHNPIDDSDLKDDIQLEVTMNPNEEYSVLDLQGKWRIKNSKGNVNVYGEVPGNVHTALIAAGLLDDPYYRFNSTEYRWVHLDDWTYSTRFQVTPEFLEKRTQNLVCDGLDTISTIVINGREVGRSDNQFIRYVYDVTGVLKPGSNDIEVHFRSAVTYGKEESDSYPYIVPPACPPDEYQPEPHANFVRKAQCSFSWDWGPAFVTQGIWKPIRLESFENAFIRHIAPSPTKSPEDLWNLDVRVDFDIGRASQVDGIISVLLPELNNSKSLQASVSPENTTVNITLENIKAEEWWPRGYGKPILYDLIVTFEVDGKKSCQNKLKTGFRTVDLVEKEAENGLTFYFKINDVPIFMKGSNWIPVDCFLDRATPERYKDLLDAAVEANMNSIRVWGGGVYEDDVFYSMADELGILIWQDLMFACAMYPVHEKFLQTVRSEIAYQVDRLSKHPCIMAWTANNENEGCLVDNWYKSKEEELPQLRQDYVKLYIHTVMDEVLKHDVTRPFLPSSPTNGEVTQSQGSISDSPIPGDAYYGDVHYYNYEDDGFDHRIYPQTRYASEYGFQSWPSYYTLLPVADVDVDLRYGSKFYDYRQHNHEAGDGTEQTLKRHFTWPNSGDPIKDFKNFIYLTQITQAICYKVQTEFYRRGRGDARMRTMGALYWQLNDIWQAPTWVTIDFAGRWKMAHYYAARFFKDTIVSVHVDEDGDTVHVHSVRDELDDKADVSLSVTLWTWRDMTPVKTWRSTVYVLGATSREVATFSLKGLLSEGGISKNTSVLTFTFEGHCDTTPLFPVSFKDVVGMKDPLLKVANIEMENSGVFDITVTSSALAAFVWFETGDIIGRFTDNGFLMTNYVEKVMFITKENVTVSDVMNALTVTSLYDVYKIKV